MYSKLHAKPKLLILALFTALLAPAARAQTATISAPQGDVASTAIPLFDVISVKPDKTASSMTRVRLTADGLAAENVTVHMLVLESYQLNEDQLIGEPAATTPSCTGRRTTHPPRHTALRAAANHRLRAYHLHCHSGAARPQA